MRRTVVVEGLRSMNPLKRWLVLASGLGLALVAAGCGSSAEATSGAAATGSAAGPIASAGETAASPGDSPAPVPMPGANDGPVGTEAPNPDDPKINFNLEDASAESLLAALAAVVHKKTRVENDAKPYLRCAKATIKAPDSITYREALVRTKLALRPAGLIITETDKELILDKAPDAPAKPCAKTAAPAPSGTATSEKQ